MEGKIDRLIEHNETNEPKLSSVSETQKQIDESDDCDDDSMDRKRLKERLKRSMSKQVNKLSARTLTPMGWMEYIFGICSADQRVGKEGSRCLLYPFVM